MSRKSASMEARGRGYAQDVLIGLLADNAEAGHLTD
jgi:hypothetical protein